MNIVEKLFGKRKADAASEVVKTGSPQHRKSPLESFVERANRKAKAGVDMAFLEARMDELENEGGTNTSAEDIRKAIPISINDIKTVESEMVAAGRGVAAMDEDDGGAPAMDAAPTAGGSSPAPVPTTGRTVAAPRAPAPRAAAPRSSSSSSSSCYTQAGLVRADNTDGKRFDPLTHYGINDKILKHFSSRTFIGFNACSLLAQHELISRACLIPAEDAIATGYKVSYVDKGIVTDGQNDTKDADFLVAVKKAADDMGLNQVCIDLTYKKKVYGMGLAIPYVEGVDMEAPYNPDAVSAAAAEYGAGIYKGWKVVDPQWVTYHLDEQSTRDPCYPDFMVPTYVVNGMKKIHKSWVVRVLNAEVPDILKPSYYFSGLPLTQMLYERVWCADKIANEAPLLAMTKRLLIADGNLEQMIADPKHSNIFMRAINYFRDNWSIFIKKPNANVQQIDTNLSELTPLNAFQYQLFAAIAQIPVTKLMKNVPSGLQATGDYEKDDYKQALRTIQDGDYTPLLRRHYELFCRVNYWNKKDVDKNKLNLDVKFNPIDTPTSAEVADIEARYAQLLNNLINGGIITVDEARSVIRTEDKGAFNHISIDTPEILKKMEEAKAQQAGGMGGIGGMPPNPNDPNGGGAGGVPPPQDNTQANIQAFQNGVQEFQQQHGLEQGGVTATPVDGGSAASTGEQGQPQEQAQGQEQGQEGTTPVQILEPGEQPQQQQEQEATQAQEQIPQQAEATQREEAANSAPAETVNQPTQTPQPQQETAAAPQQPSQQPDQQQQPEPAEAQPQQQEKGVYQEAMEKYGPAIEKELADIKRGNDENQSGEQQA